MKGNVCFCLFLFFSLDNLTYLLNNILLSCANSFVPVPVEMDAALETERPLLLELHLLLFLNRTLRNAANSFTLLVVITDAALDCPPPAAPSTACPDFDFK